MAQKRALLFCGAALSFATFVLPLNSSAAGYVRVLPFAASWTEKIVHSFGRGTDGVNPLAALVDVGGVLYGTTSGGGARGSGAVFAVNPKSGKETIVYSFGSQSNDGSFPDASLMDVGGILYGTTSGGGAIGDCNGGCGTAFAVNPKTGKETVLYSFGSQSGDGTNPFAGLIAVGGVLYGVTVYGGTGNGYGTIFALDPTTEKETVLYSFGSQSGDGGEPYGSLIDVGGVFYGTTETGGTTNDGTVFTFDPTTLKEKVLYTFGSQSGDGFFSYAPLLDVAGILYGTTYYGGTSDHGTVFTVNPKTGKETVVYAFGGSPDGFGPYAGLIDFGNILYGTTALGGTGNGGTVFAYDPKTRKESVTYRFGSKSGDGAEPFAGLIDVGGVLYGTTKVGGASVTGTLFSLTQR
jgi:uncharacterized repeat protein (TIGR03803 family)